jgi:hypothetical protein
MSDFSQKIYEKLLKIIIITLTPRGRCYDNNFLRFSTIFVENML